MGLNLNINSNGAKRGLATPPVPTDVVITVVSDTEFSIAYVSAYPVEFWYSETIDGVYTKHGDDTATPYPMTGLTAGTLYYIKARAKNGSKYSAFGSVVSATTYAPYFSDALFLLNGDIVTVGADKLFQDKTANDRNFLITGYDFDSTWTKGFPYKSAATISAPAGDATLIAEDINNYLYDSGGTPNQIPVVSLFQDVDYEHKLFCKHLAQVVDGNGVETYEPRIVDIVLYANVKATTELTNCQSYYGVPASVTAKYVPGDYSTNTAAIAVVSAGATIYNKTGVKTEAANLLPNKALTIKGIGYSVNDYGGAPSSLVSSTTGAVLLEGLIFNGKDTIALGLRLFVANSIVKRTKVYGIKTGNTFIQEGSASFNALNCLFVGSQSQTYLYNTRITDLIIDSCYISGKFAQAVFGVGATSADTQTVKNNKIVLTGSSTYTILSAAIVFNFIGNKIDMAARGVNFAGMQTANCILNMKNNIFTFTGTTQNANSGIVYSTFPTTGTLNFENNILNSVDGLGFCLNKAMGVVSVKSNLVRLKTALMQTEISVSAIYENNTLLSWSDSADTNLFTGIVISSTAGELDLPVVVQKNKILNPRYVNSSYGGGHGCIYVRDYINTEIKHNYTNGAGIASVIYKSTVAMDSTTAVIMSNLSVLSGIWNAIGNTNIYNNTIINAKTQGIKLIGADDASDISGCEIKNNIVINTSTDLLVDVTSEKVADVHIFDYNIYYSSEAKPFKHKGTTKTFAEWQALGYDAHSIFLTTAQFNELFTDFANGDYSLKTGSVAIDFCPVIEGYETGLDASTDWGSDTELPTVVTKTNTGDCGAYVH